MTKAAALYNFFSGFGIPAYEENSVYAMSNAPVLPYLTYELITDCYGDNSDVAITFSLWYDEYQWTNINAKSDEIAAAIGRSGKILKCDGGYILIQRGHPFAQRMGDDSGDNIKRIYHNLSVRFYTDN